MLDVKKLLSKILNWSGFKFTWDANTENTADSWILVTKDYTTVQHRVLPSNADVNATKVGSLWTAGEIKVRRRGNVCQMKINGATIGAASSRTTIASIPAGYRPLTQTEFYCRVSANNILTGFVNIDGTIQVEGGWTSGQKWCSAIWVID